MGGYYRYEGNTPIHPLHWHDVVELVSEGYIVLPADPAVPSDPSPLTVSPTEEDIKDKSKGDSFSKGFVLLQTMWFVVQCIARAAQHLPITELEIVTLAYTAISVLMYCFWWYKPLGVAAPVRVRIPDGVLPHTNSQEVDPNSRTFFGSLIAVLMMIYGSPGSDQSDLSTRRHVPSFYAATNETDYLFVKASLISSMAYVIFGAIHCIAWSFSFPTSIEQELWHISSVAILGLPVWFFTLFICAAMEGFAEWLSFPDWLIAFLTFLQPCTAVLYIIARLVLLTLAFTPLRALPAGAYETVAWTNFIPHI